MESSNSWEPASVESSPVVLGPAGSLGADLEGGRLEIPEVGEDWVFGD